MKWLVVGTLTLAACSFEAQPAASGAPGPGSDPDQPADPVDPTHGNPQLPPAPVADKVANLAAGDALLGTGDLTLGNADGQDPPITIDTQAMTIGGVPALPSGVTFVTARQDGNGPELAVLHVHELTIQRPVKVTGTRPLVIVCDSLALSTPIDVTAHSQQPRQNARGPSALTGDASGAIEIYAHTQIAVSSQITAGGDGPHFGPPGGGDGQPGGVLVVQSPAINNNGSLIAFDGRAGGGGNDGQIFWVSTCDLSGTVRPAPTKVTP